MKTIEERAEEWVDSPEAAAHPYNRRGMIDAYIAGSKAKYEELTRWHDPKEELPEKYKDVEIKTDKGKVSVCNMDLDELGRRFWNVSRTNYMIPDANILGWREIHE
jgi:hypothetical protein